LKDLLVRSIHSFVDLFDEGNMDTLPILKMELVFDDNKMQFYPLYEDLEEVILYVIEQITNTLQSVSSDDSLPCPGQIFYNQS
jgi:dynein heavy chain